MKTSFRVLACTGAIALTGILGISPSFALPPGGASADTPGTGSTVSPRTLQPCETLSYTVTGFPAGEVVSVKIDDGIGYGDTSTQFTGVISQATADGSGSASGSFELPCDIAEGSHWLRFLATEVVGEDGSTRGYSNRGDSDFQVQVALNDGEPGSDTGANNNSNSATTNSGNTASGKSNSGTNKSGDSGPATVRRTVTRQAPVPAERSNAAQGNAAGESSDSGNAAGKTSGNTGGSAGTPAISVAGGGSPREGDTPVGTTLIAGADGEEQEAVVYEDGETGEKYAYAAVSAGSNGAPMIGILVGGAILIVGFAAIVAYLYAEKKRRDSVA